MALDLFFGITRRDWSRRSDLAIVPTLPNVAQTQSSATEALNRAIALKQQGLAVSPRGKGAVVKKTWKW